MTQPTETTPATTATKISITPATKIKIIPHISFTHNMISALVDAGIAQIAGHEIMHRRTGLDFGGSLRVNYYGRQYDTAIGIAMFPDEFPAALRETVTVLDAGIGVAAGLSGLLLSPAAGSHGNNNVLTLAT